ncbi:hypothetical protein [uncultured Algibacter sp.]|uniref:hypothetical protein n=1 Tax=uncultured Algibacter sp. TaxID=298659 RepID=UPI003217843B
MSRCFVFIIIFLSIINIGQSQNRTSAETDRYYLVGTWSLESKLSDENLVFKRKIGYIKQDNLLIKLSNTGNLSFPNRNRPRCGNGNNNLRIENIKWKFYKRDFVFKTTKPFFKKGKVFKVLKMTRNELILKKTA